MKTKKVDNFFVNKTFHNITPNSIIHYENFFGLNRTFYFFRFPSQIESGLIDVVSPSPSYYPNLDKLRITLGDPLERVKWRSKQNLDFAFLMSYSQGKGKNSVSIRNNYYKISLGGIYDKCFENYLKTKHFCELYTYL